MTGLHKVDINTDENGRTHFKVDGHSLKRVHSATATFEAGCFPTVELELYDINTISTNAYVEFAFSPETTQKACAVISSACANDECFREATLASIRASLRHRVPDEQVDDLAEHVLDIVFLAN